MGDERGDALENNMRAGCVLFVGNVPFQTPWQVLKDHFSAAGKVRFCDLVADHDGRPKGCALVTMATQDDAMAAIARLNEQPFEGRRLIVRRFQEGHRPPLVARNRLPVYRRDGRNVDERRDRGRDGSGGGHRGGNGGTLPKPRSQRPEEAGRKLFVSNLPFDCTAAALRETFEQIGVVERAEIIVGRQGRSRGMGLVVMTSPEQARVAITEFDGIEMAGRAMLVRLDMRA